MEVFLFRVDFFWTYDIFIGEQDEIKSLDYWMEMGEWISKNYKDLYDTTKNIVKHQRDADDLFQSVVEQLLTNKNILDVPPERRKYFFIRTLKNNYYSTTSKYYYENKKYRDKQSDNFEVEDMVDEEYVDLPEIEWVYKQLEEFNWFDRDLFIMWMELGTLTQVSQKTTIPLNSVGRYIKETKQKLIELWENRN